MKLFAVRHGETEWNVQGREMGQLDSSLTPTGERQARAIAERLGRLKLDALYTSDLGRAISTARAIEKRCGLSSIKESGLRERHMGLFQGLTKAESETMYPAEYRSFKELGPDYVIPGGESGRQRLDRSIEVLEKLACRHGGEQIVVVTHGGFLMGFFEFVLGLPPGSGSRFKRNNGSISSFHFQEGRWILETWNDTSHLWEIGTRGDPLNR